MSAVVRALWSRRLPLSMLIGLPFLALMLGCWPAGPTPAGVVDSARPAAIVWAAAETGAAGVDTVPAESSLVDSSAVDQVAPATGPAPVRPAAVHAGPVRAAQADPVDSGYRSLPVGRAPPRP
jgi:hypothetical protein